jgi:hypothetical protein
MPEGSYRVQVRYRNPHREARSLGRKAVPGRRELAGRDLGRLQSSFDSRSREIGAGSARQWRMNLPQH